MLVGIIAVDGSTVVGIYLFFGWTSAVGKTSSRYGVIRIGYTVVGENAGDWNHCRDEVGRSVLWG